MKLFTCTNHDLHYPAGGASIVLANDEAEARVLLDRALTTVGLKPSAEKPYNLTEIPLDKPLALVLDSGDY